MPSHALYKAPSESLAKLVDQGRLPAARVSADHKWVCFFRRPGLESISDLAGPELKLAGLRFNPERYTPSRSVFHYDQIKMMNLATGESWLIEDLPAGKILAPSWSPDSQTLAFCVENEKGLWLWRVAAGARKAEAWCPSRLNTVLGGAFYRWCADSSAVLTRLVIEAEPPNLSVVPDGPIVRESSGDKAPVRTYQDLLKDEDDATIFEFYARSQLAKITLGKEALSLGSPALNYFYRSSPDCRYILRRTIEKPYSYLVPASRFPGRFEILKADGSSHRIVVDFPAAEELPKGFDSVLKGPRELQWRDDHAATLYWAEALDEGDMKNDCERHDRILIWEAPFEGEAKEYLELQFRYDNFYWAHENLALVSEWRFSDRKTRTWAFDPSEPEKDWTLFDDRSYNDRYKDPGSPLRSNGKFGTRVLATVDQGLSILLAGSGASPEGKVPFLRKWNSQSGETTELWASEAPHYERVIALMSEDASQVLTLRESVDEPPNFFLRSLDDKSLKALTEQPHPTPEFRGLKKEIISYKRKDGVDLSGTLYLPPDYDGGRVPLVMWAYPLEYKDPSVAGQVNSSPYEFNRVSYWGPLPFLAMGWAVLDDPKMPIIGEGDKLPNDSFRQQLVDSAEAAIQVLERRGICDPQRVAIGGHSYGAFMVANLLAHSDLFQAGIARSGAYNRSLTPFGFQGEERDFWEGQSVYCDMSPFFHAEKIDKPILMIHGAEDNNSGTYPMQSERFFAAIKGLGGQARLVLLPKESHAYRARESLLHMLWEQETWLKEHL